MSTRKTIVAATAASILLSSCGNKPAPQQIQVPPVQATADAAVLRAGDLPEGWSPRPPGERLDEAGIWAAITKCLGVEGPAPTEGLLGQVAQARSDTYGAGDGSSVTSAVAHFATEKQVLRISDSFADGRFDQCAEQAVAESAAFGPGAVPTEAADLQVGLTDSHAFRGSATVGEGDAVRQVFLDIVVVFEPTSIVRLAFLSSGQPFPQDLQQALTAAVVERS